MSGSRYLDELTRIQEQLNALLDRVMRSSEIEDAGREAPGTWSPIVDVLETEDGFRVYAELPGVQRADIDLTLRQRRLELSGHRRPDSGDGGFSLVERRQGPFHRVFELGEDVDPETISAEFQSGVLAISLTKGRSRHAVTRIPLAEEAE